MCSVEALSRLFDLHVVAVVHGANMKCVELVVHVLVCARLWEPLMSCKALDDLLQSLLGRSML